MSKAILVMEMPKCCNECCLSLPVEDKVERVLCRGLEKYHSTTVFSKRPDWCPLRELPEEHNTDARQVGEQWAVFNQGWNACLDAIEGSEANE